MKILKSLWSWITPVQRQSFLAAAFVMLTGNASFLQQVLKVYGWGGGNSGFLISLCLLFTFATAFFFSLVCHGRVAKWVLAIYFVASASAAYFMDKYGTVIDSTMIQNMLETNTSEAQDLMSLSLLVRLLLLGVLPAAFVLLKPVPVRGLFAELRGSAVTLGLLLVLMLGSIAPFTSQYATFFREHKMLRFYANPTYFTYSSILYAKSQFSSGVAKEATLREVADDAKLVEPSEHHELVILVVGETARADRFSLNGYAKDTNPLLSKENVISFTNVSSCGTSTAVSVPCMFSVLKAEDYDGADAAQLTNVLDVLQKNGVKVLWRDNNSDSKGVALRVPYEDYKSPDKNTICDVECRDVGMLIGLDEFIQNNPEEDILIVLHQMGNHGPAYYKRYPKEFEVFKPVCETNELSACTAEQINNTYDNAIRYTDYFLAQTIEFLKKYDNSHETAMLYVSDHGESLGEMGLYLHGAPRAFAPKEQTHVASVVWLGTDFDYRMDELKPLKDHSFSHDDLFCGLLLAYEMDTAQCPQNRQEEIRRAHAEGLSNRYIGIRDRLPSEPETRLE